MTRDYEGHVKGEILSSGFYKKFQDKWNDVRTKGVGVMEMYGRTEWDVIANESSPSYQMVNTMDGTLSVARSFETVSGYKSKVVVSIGKRKFAEFEYKNEDRSDVLKMMRATSGEIMDFIRNRCGVQAVLESSMLIE